jgi:hypothetical protein
MKKEGNKGEERGGNKEQKKSRAIQKVEERGGEERAEKIKGKRRGEEG